MQTLKVVVHLSVKGHGSSTSQAILVFRHKRNLLFWPNSQESFSLWSLHCQPTNGAVNITFVNRRQEIKPKPSQHWCPCNLQVIKVVVNGFAALAVLLPWAVMHWCAFIFLHFECKQKSKQSIFFPLCSLWHFFDLCVCCLYEACPLLHILASKWCSPLPSCGSILCAELRVLCFYVLSGCGFAGS